MTLMELTGKESGIVVYGDRSVGVFNWANLGDDRLPAVLTSLNVLFDRREDPSIFADVKTHRFEDVRAELPGTIYRTGETANDGLEIADTDMDIAYDRNGDLLRLFLTKLEDCEYAGSAYTLQDGTKILTLDMWC